jgi:predicted Holliday junction resolvase-like endonuclease
MKYRGVEYYIAQGVEVGTWKFSTSMNDKIRTVRAKSRQDAAKVVERRIEEALAPKKRRLVPPASK